MPSHRLAHYALLLAVCGLLTLPNLGGPSLWDMDEGVNAECTREMMEAGTWVVPTFNWDLRAAKPVMTYWLQRLSMTAFGVNEWAARLPSVLLGMGTVLLTYELGRRIFGAAAGLLGGIVLASALQFCIASHAATPDAPLLFFTTLTFLLFWVGHENGRRALFGWPAVASGLAVLSKGPVGLALPGLVVLAYFAWNRELRRVWDRKLAGGVAVFLLVAAPWFALVTSETRGKYAEEFFLNENAARFLDAKEDHGGPVVYYVAALFLFFAPWCCFIGATLWYAAKGTRQSPPVAMGGLSPEVRANRFLLCWFLAYLAFFSLARTKLPNYIAPLYPALALLTARFLLLWKDRRVTPARWVLPAGVAGVVIVGVVWAGAMLVAGGDLPVSAGNMRVFPGLGPWAAVGLIPVAGAAAMAWCLRAGNRAGVLAAVTVTAVAFIGLAAAGPPAVVDRYKASKELALTSGTHQPGRDIRLGALLCYQESMTFYAERRVERLGTAADAAAFLNVPWPAYLFVPEPVWRDHLAGKVTVAHRVTAKRYDFYRNADILVVTNE